MPASAKAVTLVVDVIRKHRKEVGSRWRKLPDGRIASIVLAHLRHAQRLSDLAGGTTAPTRRRLTGRPRSAPSTSGNFQARPERSGCYGWQPASPTRCP
ncbi:MAG: hypothetical protein ACRDNS_11160, partial [Trebonia sp.]